jgi:hypothetical protein
MLRIRFPERVMAVWAGEITFGPFVRADGHGEVGKRMPLAPDLEFLVPAERCPFHFYLFSMKCFFEAFENRERNLR